MTHSRRDFLWSFGGGLGGIAFAQLLAEAGEIPGAPKPRAEFNGGLHHVAISVEPDRWHEIQQRLDEAGVSYVVHSEVSMYFTDPDGARVELIADPLGEMYGAQVL